MLDLLLRVLHDCTCLRVLLDHDALLVSVDRLLCLFGQRGDNASAGVSAGVSLLVQLVGRLMILLEAHAFAHGDRHRKPHALRPGRNAPPLQAVLLH